MLTPPLCGFSVPCHQFGPALSRSEQISVRPMAGKKGVWGSRDCGLSPPFRGILGNEVFGR